MSVLEEQIKASLLPGMYIPEEFSFLFKWIEDNKYYIEGGNKRLGFLYPYEESVEQRNNWRNSCCLLCRR